MKKPNAALRGPTYPLDYSLPDPSTLDVDLAASTKAVHAALDRAALRFAYANRYPWVDPTLGYPSNEPVPGVTKLERCVPIAVSIGASHKSLDYMEAYHTKGLRRLKGRAWRLFNATHYGDVDGVRRVWGMFAERIGAFHVMAIAAHCRELTDSEVAYFAEASFAMVGSHTGKTSYTFPAGPKKRVDASAIFAGVNPPRGAPKVATPGEKSPGKSGRKGRSN